MARLTWECIAPKDENGCIIKYWNTHCDRCHKPILEGSIYLRIRDGFGYNHCIDCYIEELKNELQDINWVKERNSKIQSEIQRLTGKKPSVREEGSKK